MWATINIQTSFKRKRKKIKGREFEVSGKLIDLAANLSISFLIMGLCR